MFGRYPNHQGYAPLIGKANKMAAIGKIRVDWSVYPLKTYEPPEVCFEQSYKSYL